jgi:hypothetical protein
MADDSLRGSKTRTQHHQTKRPGQPFRLSSASLVLLPELSALGDKPPSFEDGRHGWSSERSAALAPRRFGY